MEDDNRKTAQELALKLAQAEARIAELERRLGPDSGDALVNDVFEFHKDVVLYIDAAKGDILWGNRAATEFYGYSRQELTSLHISDLNVLSREETRAPIREVLERTRSRFLFVHRLKNGELRNIEAYSVPIVLKGHEMICVFIRDITGLSDVETRVETSAALQDMVLTSMELVPFYCRKRELYEPIYVGGSIGTVTGFPAERFYSDPSFWYERLHPEDRGRVEEQLSHIDTKGAAHFEYRWQVESGDWRWFAMTVRRSPCEEAGGGNNVCITGFFKDITGRKAKERALLEREERYRTVADFTHDWEFWIGPDGSFIYVSPSFERVTGYAPEALKEDPELLFSTIVHPVDRSAVRAHLMDGLRSGERLSFDFRIVTKSGEVRWIGHVSQAVFDDKGDPLGRRASNRDITGLKETLQALKDKNQFINAMMDNSPASIYAKDVDGRYLFANARFMDYAGKPSHEVLGKTDFGLFPNNMAERFRQGDNEVLTTGDPIFEEVSINNAGKIEHWTSTKFPLVNSDGDVLGVCGISLDVTGWREAEASLRRLTRAVEQSPVSIAMTDTAGRIISVNPHFCAVSGYCEDDVIGRKLGFMLADEDERFYDPVWDRVKSGDDWHGEIRNRTKSGEVIWERTTISPVRDNEDLIVNFVVVKDDITEHKRLDRLKKDVERIVRHDLKSPIMSFMWVPRSLRKAENITEKQAEMLLDMEEAAHRLFRMVSLSLDLFKMEEGTYEFVPEDINILRVIQNVLRDLHQALESHHVTVRVSVDDRDAVEGDCLVVRGEELLCHSMLANLIGNAMEASSPNDVITVNCAEKGETTISVHNPAPVPEDIRDTFFDKYVTSGKRYGTGLGTYSARLVAETQGGKISMKSSEEEGTTITVAFASVPCT